MCIYFHPEKGRRLVSAAPFGYCKLYWIPSLAFKPS
nr:MAG TPA: hypothetical protein [Caudoviricetes sp.]